MSADYLVFENSGEIDVRTITTFGCSVKETKNPIGYFGTGLKYAIAVLLRTGHEILIQSGGSQFSLVSREGSIRGKEFGFVHLTGDGVDKPTGFTTELGKNWEVWMAYRELHCNSKDEQESLTFVCAEQPVPRIGMTRVIVSGLEIMKAHASRIDFICEGKPDFVVGTLEVFRRPTNSFFYRGIKVMNFQQNALYSYNQTAKVELTEDRTVKDPYQVGYTLAREILGHAEGQFLEQILLADTKVMEHWLDFHGWSEIPSNDFFPTVAKLQRHSVTRINQTALRLWREKGRGFIDPRRVNPTKVQQMMLEKAIKFCERSGFMLRDEYPILIAETLGENGVLAMADKTGNQIFLTERIFQTGTKAVARALVEEYLHLKFKFEDKSLEMQNYLFDKMMTLAEELTGEPI